MYRLNISGTASWYKMYYSIRWWEVYRVNADGHCSMDSPLTYCGESDLADCAGNWKVYDEEIEGWIYDQDATSLVDDCTFSECDLSGLTATDTMC